MQPAFFWEAQSPTEGSWDQLKAVSRVTSIDMHLAFPHRGYLCLKGARYIHGFSTSHTIRVLGFHWLIAPAVCSFTPVHFGYHLKRDQEPDTTIFCAFTILFLPSARFANASRDFFLQSIWEVTNKPNFKDDIYWFEGNAYLEQDSLSSDTHFTPDGSTSKLKAYSPRIQFPKWTF